MKRTWMIALVALLGLAYCVPGEQIVQLGLRKVALEQGIAAASRHHSWEASVDAGPNPMRVAQVDEPLPAAKKPKGRR